MHPIKQLNGSRELLWNLTLRELRTKYRHSLLGWSWSLLNPLTTVALYGFVFGVLFNAVAPEGTNSGVTGFVYFLICAVIPWNFFSMIVNTGMGSISGNPGLVRRVSFQREVLVFSNVLHGLVQAAIELSLLIVVMLFAGSPVIPFIPVVALITIFLALFGAGIGLVLSALAVYFKDLTYLWGIVMQVWFFLTPIVYPPQVLDDSLPEWATNLLSANAFSHFVDAYRATLYDARLPDLGTILMIISSSLVTFSAGWWLFIRLGRRLAEEV